MFYSVSNVVDPSLLVLIAVKFFELCLVPFKVVSQILCYGAYSDHTTFKSFVCSRPLFLPANSNLDKLIGCI